MKIMIVCLLLTALCSSSCDLSIKSEPLQVSSDKIINDIDVTGRAYTIVFDGNDITIEADLYSDELMDLVTATYFTGKSLKVDGKIAPNGLSTIDYSDSQTNPVIFSVVAEDDTVKHYNVVITSREGYVAEASSADENDNEDSSDNVEDGKEADFFDQRCFDQRPGSHLRISSVFFHGDHVDDEYFEIHNPSAESVNLNRSNSATDEFRVYRMTRSGNIQRLYTFPRDTVIEPGSSIIVANDNSTVYSDSPLFFEDETGLIASEEGVFLLTVYTANSGAVIDIVAYGKGEDSELWGALIVDTMGQTPFCSAGVFVGPEGEPVELINFWNLPIVEIAPGSRGIRRKDYNVDADSADEWEIIEDEN
ncbi:MAG: lamin tail domain-containing protein [Spirochaetes bacterium]|jgi:hypothetical protein|nr:lamin tail domain-containing protein [Spirochaetota bacterium]